MTYQNGSSALAAMVIAVGLGFAAGSPSSSYAAAASSGDTESGAPAPTPAPAPAPSLLPGGASSLRETYDDWIVACAVSGKTKQCSVSQQQQDSQSGQRILAVEVGVPAADGTKVTLVMPFGIELGKGVTLRVDEGGSSDPFPFKTCLPVGCLVDVTLDRINLEIWRKGTNLRLKTTSVDNGKDVTLTISLKGFGAAVNRLMSLAR